MLDFVVLHLLQYGPASRVCSRQARKVLVQVRFNLFFRFRNKPEADPIAKRARYRADRIGSEVPQRVQHAGAPAQFPDPVLTPCQMIGFLRGGPAHDSGDLWVARGQRLTLIQRLRRDLPGMIDPHQAYRFARLIGRQRPVRPPCHRGLAQGPGRRG